MKTIFKFLIFLLAIPFVTNAEIRLPKVFCDHMVIQRNIDVPVWGWGNAGEEITVSFMGETKIGKSDNAGNWRVEFPPMKHGGPYEMKLTSGQETITIKDIWIGDVWVCSGQSNMEWTVTNSRDPQKEIAEATDTKIRHFKVPRSTSYLPKTELVGGSWETCSPETAGDFTAVGYFFARSLRAHHDVPIGLLHTSWGGSRVEPWMSSEILGYKNADESSQFIQKEVEIKKAKLIEKFAKRLKTIPTKDAGLAEGKALWATLEFDDTSWQKMNLPGLWEQQGWDGLDGIVWFRKEISLSKEEAAAGVELHLGRIDDGDITWMNGHKVGGMKQAWNVDRIYKVAPQYLKEGRNVIAIRVEDNGYGGGVHCPEEMLAYHCLGKKYSLVGEWNYKVSMVDLAAGIMMNHVPTVLYNQMIHPILDFPIKGVIWYQGESNAGGQDAIDYHQEFSDMIVDWRKRWNCGEFPFLYVQLANFMTAKPTPENSDWAILRESQTKTLALPNTGQAVIIDIGEAEDIHPKNKQDVGYRLSLAARKLGYGEELVYSGPVYKSMKIEGHKIRIQFDHIGSGLWAKNKYGYLNAFAIAGSDQQFVWAKAQIEGNEIVVWSNDISNPVAVRYAWADNPDDANLYNKENLPACPFRTDNW